MLYPNGQWPESMFVVIGSGTDQHGPWKHLAPTGTAARWFELVRLARERYGVTLRVTPGWNMYRPLWVQRIYRTALGIWAAVPGYSSHGGDYRGAECAAIDVQNWAKLGANAEQAWPIFVALCAEVGFITDFVTPRERWHIGDRHPWVVPDFASGSGAVPFPTPEDDMPTMHEFLNTPAYTGGPTISEFFKAVDQGGVATQVWARTVDRGLDANGNRVLIPALQELADAKSLAMQLLGRPVGDVSVDVDESAIAAALAPLITANMGALTDDDIERLKVALADEIGRRLTGERPA